MIGLGCMRLSTDRSRNEASGAAVIHAALTAGVTLLDTADVYCWDEKDVGHNERLIAAALKTWTGDRTKIQIATKGGLTRPAGRWVPDGRAKHLRAACVASIRALDVDVIDLYQLHVVDPKTPIATSVRALAALHDEGLVRQVGLCNVNVRQIEVARQMTEIAAVQVSLNPFDEDNFRNGVAEYCREHEIRLVAYRPLGGERKKKLSRDAVLVDIAGRHGVTPLEIALAWLRDLDERVVPIPGATRVESARSLARVLTIRFTDADRDRLDEHFPAGRLLRVPRAARRPPKNGEGEVVVLMGMPAAGKSTAAQSLVDRGYERLNRDQRGGVLADLIPELEAGLAAGRRRWVLDNTYPSRKSRNHVIESAWKHGVPVRCVWLKTLTDDAQINAISRMIKTFGHLPSPEEIRARSKKDPTTLGPNALFRYDRELEPPVLDEGFAAIDERSFVRSNDSSLTGRAVLLEYDGVLCTSASGKDVATEPDDVAIPPNVSKTLSKYHAEGWTLLSIAWRPQLENGEATEAAVHACFARTRKLLGVEIDFRHCPHKAGPPRCWCRKPLPGLALEFAFKHRIATERSMLVGRSPADKTLARRLRMQYHDHLVFFGRDSTEAHPAGLHVK